MANGPRRERTYEQHKRVRAGPRYLSVVAQANCVPAMLAYCYEFLALPPTLNSSEENLREHVVSTHFARPTTNEWQSRPRLVAAIDSETNADVRLCNAMHCGGVRLKVLELAARAREVRAGDVRAARCSRHDARRAQNPVVSIFARDPY